MKYEDSKADDSIAVCGITSNHLSITLAISSNPKNKIQAKREKQDLPFCVYLPQRWGCAEKHKQEHWLRSGNKIEAKIEKREKLQQQHKHRHPTQGLAWQQSTRQAEEWKWIPPAVQWTCHHTSRREAKRISERKFPNANFRLSDNAAKTFPND